MTDILLRLVRKQCRTMIDEGMMTKALLCNRFLSRVTM